MLQCEAERDVVNRDLQVQNDGDGTCREKSVCVNAYLCVWRVCVRAERGPLGVTLHSRENLCVNLRFQVPEYWACAVLVFMASTLITSTELVLSTCTSVLKWLVLRTPILVMQWF